MVMTYPPQQPGPYGGQPDPYGQQPGWQDGYNQQQPAWGQQPNYGGFPGGQPPRKSKTGLIIGLVVAGVLVVGGGVTAIILLTGGDDSKSTPAAQTTQAGGGDDAGSPQAVVDRVIKAVDDKDADAATQTLCDPKKKSPAFELDKVKPSWTLKTSLNGKIRESSAGAFASLSIKVTETGRSSTNTLPLTLDMKEKDGKWCVSEAVLNPRASSGSTTRRPPSTSPTY
ncbi:hypothetical protein ALI144C_16475 [Actinosynnema sp. ALI-1.44]|nr:hypothetical protein ALI144C_16475 [Actinosynnema sp. ALI-1.44]